MMVTARLSDPSTLPTSSSSPSSPGVAGRRRGLALAVTVAAAALLGLGGCSREPDVIKIGVGQPLSGPLAALGQDMVNGTKMAVDEINARGGVRVGGKRIKLEVVSADDKSDVEAGKVAARALVDAGVTVAIAHLNSGVSIGSAKIYADAGIPQLAISTNPAYTKQGVPTTLRLVANDNLQAKALGSYAAQLAGAERFAVVDDGTPYGKGLADDAAKELVAAKKQVLLRKTTDDKTTDFGAIVDEMAKGKVDVLVAALNDFQIEAIVELAAKAGYSRLRIIGGDTLKTNKLAAVADKVAAIYATSPIIEAGEFPSGGVFLDNFVLRVTVPTWKPVLPEYPLQDADASAAMIGERQAYWPETGAWAQTPTYQFEQLQPGNVIVGPAIVEAELTTIVVPPGQKLSIERHGLGILEAVIAAPPRRRIGAQQTVAV